MDPPPAPDRRGFPIYRSGRARRIRALNLGSLAFAALMAWLGALSWGAQEPAASPAERAAVALVALLAGLGAPLGLAAYGRRYVRELWITEDGRSAVVTQVGFLRPHARTLALAELGPAVAHRGQVVARSTVNAPWISLRVRGGPGLILDLQGAVLDERRWQAFLRGAGRPARRPAAPG
jgi:hypothetical protein